MSKKIYALLLAAVMVLSVFAFAGCDGNDTPDNSKVSGESSSAEGNKTDDFKIGFIFLHDENSTYDKNFMDAAHEAQKALKLTDEQVIFKVNVGESNACYEAACELVDAGCDIVFADSFGHEAFMAQAAEEYPEVQFCHATGTSAHVKKLANFHNAFASIYEGRYVAGIAAGMKLNEMIEAGTITAEQAVIGYVGAFDYAEVVSGMTSFFLGARSVCESATMKVTYTNQWFDIALEREAALSLIDSGCVLISQHADSEGAPKACEERKVPNVAYNISTIPMGPTTAIISSKIDWTPYFKLIIEKTMAGKGSEIPFDWCGGFSEGSVQVTELNEAVAAEGTKEALDKAIADFKAGTLKVFDTSKFTVNNKTLDEYFADVDGDFKGETNVIHDGYFDESAKDQRSAPYFDIKYIDGISNL